MATGDRTEKTERKLKVVRKETAKLDSDGLAAPFPQEWLLADAYNATIYDSLQSHLSLLKERNDQLVRSAERIKDNLTLKLESDLGKQELLDLKKMQYNSALGNLLKKDKQRSGLLEQGTKRIHVKVAPVYRNPESRLGRAHFYAPFKTLGNMRFPTLGFNASVIILMTLLLYIALYYNWLGMLLNSWKGIKRKLSRSL